MKLLISLPISTYLFNVSLSLSLRWSLHLFPQSLRLPRLLESAKLVATCGIFGSGATNRAPVSPVFNWCGRQERTRNSSQWRHLQLLGFSSATYRPPPYTTVRASTQHISIHTYTAPGRSTVDLNRGDRTKSQMILSQKTKSQKRKVKCKKSKRIKVNWQEVKTDKSQNDKKSKAKSQNNKKSTRQKVKNAKGQK